MGKIFDDGIVAPKNSNKYRCYGAREKMPPPLDIH